MNIIKRILSPESKIVKKAKWYAIAPLLVIVVGIFMVALVGFNMGLDFTGGRIVTISGFAESDYAATQTIVKEEMNSKGIDKPHFQREERTGGGGGIVMTVKFTHPDGLDSSDEVAVKAFFEELQDSVNAQLTIDGLSIITIEDSDSLSASASSEKIMNVFFAVAVALIFILIYMFVRFKLNSGVAAVVGLFHDVLIMTALVAIFQIQINFVFVAALITVIAYSLNNTLILFDRVRDKEKDVDSRLTTEQIVDVSIKETFARTLITTITTLVPVIVLAVLGVPLIQEFAIPITFGLIAGTFSTIFLTSSLYVRFEEARKRRAKQKLSGGNKK